MIFLQLFYTFFKIGLFGFGGGYAMISMIQGEVVTRHEWLSSTEFTDIIAISQMTPGPIGINSATYVGYSAVVNAGYSHVIGILGSVVATVSVVLPSFILMVLISKFLFEISEASDHRFRVQGFTSGGSRTAGSRCTGSDERRELRYLQLADSDEYLTFCRNIHRLLPLQSQSHSLDCNLRFHRLYHIRLYSYPTII